VEHTILYKEEELLQPSHPSNHQRIFIFNYSSIELEINAAPNPSVKELWDQIYLKAPNPLVKELWGQIYLKAPQPLVKELWDQIHLK